MPPIKWSTQIKLFNTKDRNKIMTPKEKAMELMLDYYKLIPMNTVSFAKQCALIAVEFSREFITGDLNESFDKTMYLFEVKQEIEKL
jgi:hypothetical protein